MRAPSRCIIPKPPPLVVVIYYLPHDPADYALRLRLSRWFDLAGIARQKFSEENWDVEALLAEAEKVNYPYNIDIA